MILPNNRKVKIPKKVVGLLLMIFLGAIGIFISRQRPVAEISAYGECTYCDTSLGICEFVGQPCTTYTCNPGHRCSGEPTPPPYGNCPPHNNFPWCRQNNPIWANSTISACEGPFRNYMCGQSVVAAVWCKYSNGLCNLQAEVNAGSFNYGNQTLCLTDSDDLYDVMNRSQYEGDYNIYKIRPDTNEMYITREKLIESLRAGNVIIASGRFRPIGATEAIDHHTLITGVDSDGKLIFNDPYFNCDNTGSSQICTDRLEDQMVYMNFNKAILVTPPNVTQP